MGEPAHEEIEEKIREIQARKSNLAKTSNGDGEISNEDRVPFSASTGVMDRDIYGSVQDKFIGHVDSIDAHDPGDDDDYDMSENGSFASKNQVEAPKQFFEEVVDKDHDPLSDRRVPRVADREDEYRARHRKLMISPPRIDPFEEGGKTDPKSRTYQVIMREQVLSKDEPDMMKKKSVDKTKAEEDKAESEAEANRRRRWGQPAAVEEPPAKKVTIDFHEAQTPNALNQWLDLFESWSNKERLTALESLISSDICDAGQIRHLYSLIEPQLQRDFISLLPKELALYVLHFLEPKDLLKAAQTCRTWRILCEDNLLWREKCQEEGLLEEGEFLSSASGFNGSSSTYSLNLSHDIPFIRSEYKRGYLRLKTIEYNWRFGRFPNDLSSDSQQQTLSSQPSQQQHPQQQSSSQQPSSQQSQEPKVKHRMLKDILHLKGHDDHVITCLQFNPESNLIVSGSDDNTLKVWSSTTGKCLRTLTGHTGGVWSSQLSPNNIVISGSTDRTLKIWDALSGRCKHTLYGHTSTVRCMALHGNQVVSGSRDTTLRVWDINTGNCNHVLVGHCAAVRCVQFNGSIVVSGAYDYLVKVWDAQTETCLHTLDGHTNRVYSLQFDGENIVSGSLDTSIRVWSASTGQSRHILTGHQSLTSGMQLRGNVLVSGNADSTVKVWDINTGECLATLAGENKHQSAVTCLQFNSKFVITSSDDGTVKLWDLATGEFIRNLVSLSSGGSGGVVWRIRASHTKLVCAVGSRNGTEETKLLVLNFDTDDFNTPQPETSRLYSNDSRSINL